MNLDFNQICRFCLQLCEDYIDLRDVNGVKNLASDVIEKIQFCYCIKIDLSEPLPTKICHKCVQVLMLFYVTKTNLGVSEQFLKNVLHDRSIFNSANVCNSPGVSVQESKKIDDLKAKAKKLEVSVLLNKIRVPNTILLNQDNVNNFTKQNPSVERKRGSSVVENKDNEKSKCDCKIIENVNKKSDSVKNTVQNSVDINLVKKEKKFMSSINDIKDLVVKTEIDECSSDKGNEVNHVEKGPIKTVKVIGTNIDLNNILSPEIKRSRKTINVKNSSQVSDKNHT